MGAFYLSGGVVNKVHAFSILEINNQFTKSFPMRSEEVGFHIVG